MGTILTGYGGAAYDHEGYAAQVLDDGTLTGTYSAETRPRMIGAVVAACDCGWHGTTSYPTTVPFDDEAEELALLEWEYEHARPLLAADLNQQREALARALRTTFVADADRLSAGQFSSLPAADQLARLNLTLTHLADATHSAHDIHQAINTHQQGS